MPHEQVHLRTARKVFDPIERADAAAGITLPEGTHTSVERSDATTISLESFHNLMTEFRRRKDEGRWASDRAVSDRWLAPRLHFALRLTRAQAGDKGLWHWLAVAETHDYVEWRWAADGEVADHRWYGAINKQALARLWWGAELFRDGSDYLPVEYVFVRQDFPNSYLHRPLIRCRSFALGILNALLETTHELSDMSSDQVNDLARVLNLCTAGRPPEAATGFQKDDPAALDIWAADDAPIPASWEPNPAGPPARDTTETSIRQGTELARHGLTLARASAE